MPNLELNPILVREVRARWRKWPAFAVVFGFAMLLAVVVWWRYANFTSANTLSPLDNTRGAALGRDLFTTLTITQVVGWMFLAPLMTATALLNERELGLLEGMQLSELSPREIINGKLLSMLAFVGLMLLAPLPIVAVCFLLGGVSPFEFVVAGLTSFMTSVTTGLIGQRSAAWNHGRGAVLAKAAGVILAWSVLPCGLLGNPMLVLSTLLLDVQLPMLFLPVSMATCSAIAFLVWRDTIKGMSRPLWQQSGELAGPRTQHEPRRPASPADDDQCAEPIAITGKLKCRHRRQLPFVGRLQFQNPIMAFEVRRRLRIQWTSLRNAFTDGGMVALTAIFAVYLLPVLVAFYLNDNLAVYRCLTWGGLAVALLAAGLWGAATFTRERELQTWEGLLLTALSYQEIIAGKLKSVLFTCLYYSVPLVIGLMGCVRRLAFYHSLDHTHEDILSLPEILGAIVIGASAVWCYTAFAMLISWLCKRTWVAMAWTLTLPLLTALAAALNGGYSHRTLIGTALQLLNPWAGFTAVHIAATLHEAALQVAHAAGTMLLLDSVFLILLNGLMGRNAGTEQKFL